MGARGTRMAMVARCSRGARNARVSRLVKVVKNVQTIPNFSGTIKRILKHFEFTCWSQEYFYQNNYPNNVSPNNTQGYQLVENMYLI